MIRVPHPSAPRRFVVLALVLLTPALGLAILASRTVRLDRQSTTAAARETADGMALSAIRSATQIVDGVPVEVVERLETDEAPQLLEGSNLLVLDSKLRLLWPNPGEWPPVPGRGSAGKSALEPLWEEAIRAVERGENRRVDEVLEMIRQRRDASAEGVVRADGTPGLGLLEAQVLWKAGRTSEAVEAFHRVLISAPVGAVTPAGLSMKELAAHSILDLAAGDPARLPAGWGAPGFEGVRELAGLTSTPLSEEAIGRFETELLPRLAASASDSAGSNGLGRARALLERRAFARRAHEMLMTQYGAGERGWRDAMSIALARDTWIAIRLRGRSASGSSVGPTPGPMGGTGPEGIAESRQVYLLVKWAEIFSEVQKAVRGQDAREVFGYSVRVEGPGFQIHEETPAGIEPDLMATRTSALPSGMTLTVGVGLAKPDVYFAGHEQRRRLVWTLVAAGLLVSGIGAVVTWWMLVRQFRLGVQKTNFVSSVSHELRAPLASVRLLADNLENDRIPDVERRRLTLRLIGRECRRLGLLVDNVLDLGRMERGQMRMDPEVTDMTALVRETVRLAAVAGEERGVRVQCEPDGAAAGLVANVDGRAVQQALSNLLENAIKHSPAGSEVVVVLETEARENRFRIGVTDSGPGIPDTERERIFEPFFRLGSELRRETPGIGIGLAIVRHVASSHGGRVWVEPGRSGGSRFVMEFPWATALVETEVA